jgi:hypothetical protein
MAAAKNMVAVNSQQTGIGLPLLQFVSALQGNGGIGCSMAYQPGNMNGGSRFFNVQPLLVNTTAFAVGCGR